MKKIFLLFFIIVFTAQMSFAAEHDKDYSVNFNGTKFHLLYSIKNKDFGGYLNEYYKKGETYNVWSELIAVHHFPNAYSPIDRIKDFKDYLGSMHVPSSLTFDDKKNTAMIDFIMISDKQLPVVLEFNIFKYEKSKKCGSIAIQYAKRYSATTSMQIQDIKRDFEHNRKKLINKVKNFEIPEIITKDIDRCISASDVKELDKELSQDNKIDENELSLLSENTENKSDVKEGLQKETSDEKTEKPSEVVQLVDKKALDEKTESDIIAPKIEPVIVAEKSDNDNISVKTEEKSVEEALPDSNNGANSVKEDVVKSSVEPKEKQDNNELQIVELKSETETQAPVPTINKELQNRQELKKAKNVKEINYVVVNNKEKYIAEPRTKKELQQEVNLNKQKQKEKLLQAKERAKAERINAEEQAKADKIKAKQIALDEKNKAKEEAIKAKALAKADEIKAKQEALDAKNKAKLEAKNAKEQAKADTIRAKQKAIYEKNKAKEEAIKTKALAKADEIKAKQDALEAKNKAKLGAKNAKEQVMKIKPDKKKTYTQPGVKKDKETIREEKLQAKQERYESKLEARGERYQARVDKRDYKRQLKAERRQERYDRIDKKKLERENKIYQKKALKKKIKEEKVVEKQAKLDKKALNKEASELKKQTEINKKAVQKAAKKAEKRNKKSVDVKKVEYKN